VTTARNRSAPLLTLAATLFAGALQAASPAAHAAESDFQRIQDTIFTPHCTGCHSGLFAPQRLKLDARNSYRLLVGIQSAEVPALQRVKSGDPNASYLVHKLEGHAAVGIRMPASGPALTAEAIDLIRSWIARGAPGPTP